MTIRNIALVLVLMLVVGLVACGGTPQEAEATVSPFVQALPADRAEMQIAAPGGVLPCGLAEVDWGIRIFRLSDFPACQTHAPALAVYCLDSTANWSQANVLDVEVNPDTQTVTFNSQQSGICGLFPLGG